MKSFSICALCAVFIVLSCRRSPSTSKQPDLTPQNDSIESVRRSNEPDNSFVKQSTDQQTAENLKTFLREEYLKEDLAFLQPLDRKFQFYKIDLNNDGNDEILVRFLSPYFCGTGGCTFLLLDKYGKIITKFTVTRPPFFVEQTKVNGWAILLVKDSGVFKELTFNDGSYPSNPTVLPKAPYDAPSGHAEILFDDDLYKCKTFQF